jgi:hypothetical protein
MWFAVCVVACVSVCVNGQGASGWVLCGCVRSVRVFVSCFLLVFFWLCTWDSSDYDQQGVHCVWLWVVWLCVCVVVSVCCVTVCVDMDVCVVERVCVTCLWCCRRTRPRARARLQDVEHYQHSKKVTRC